MSGLETLALADELIAHYMANTRTQAIRSGHTRLQIKNMPAAWQEACGLVGDYRLILHDLLGVSLAAGDTPLPINKAKFNRACEYLISQGDEAKNRSANWRTAIRVLPPHVPHLVEQPGDFQDRRNKRAGDGPEDRMTTELVSWKHVACAPLTTSFEGREQLSVTAANSITGYIRRAVATLAATDPTYSDICLLDLVSQQNFDAWLETDDEHSPMSTLATIDAFIRVRKDLLGNDADVLRGDAVLKHMHAQRVGRRDAHALAGDAVRQLTTILTDRRRFELMPVALMEVARRGDLPAHVRIKLANQAPAMHAAMEYALTPSEVGVLAEDENGEFTPPARACEAAIGPVNCQIMNQLLRQRREIRKVLEASESRMVMVSPSGNPMSSKEICNGLARTQRQFNLVKHPLQRFRDYAAVRMLLADGTSLERVSILLSIRNPVLVHRRYSALLPRSADAAPTDVVMGVRRAA